MAPALQVLEPRHLLAFSTPLFTDINQLGVSAVPDSFVALNDQVYFVADDGRTGSELWKSDGSTNETVLVSDINPGPAGSLPENLVVFENDLFFTALDGEDERGIWKVDSATGNTVQVFDAFAGDVTEIDQLTPAGGNLFFTAFHDTSGNELWSTDGVSGAQLVRDINLDQTVEEGPGSLTSVGDKIFFTSYTNGYDNRELFESDGTLAGTLLVANIDGDPLDSSDPRELTDVNGTLFFTADHPDTGIELYKSTGAAGATERLSDINAGSSSSDPSELTVLGTDVFFSADNGITGTQLYKSNGTTVDLVANTTPDGTGSSSPTKLTAVGGELFFVAEGGKVPGPIAAHSPAFSTDNSFRSNSSNFAGLVDIRNDAYDGIVAGGNSGGSFSLPSQGGSDDGPGWVSTGARPGDTDVGLSGVEVGDFVIRDMDALNSSDVDIDATWDWTVSDPAGLDNIQFSGFASGNSFVTSDEAMLFELFINGQETRESFLELSGAALDNWYADRDANNISLSYDTTSGPTVTSVTVRLTFKPDGGDIKTPNDGSESIVMRASLTAFGQSSGVAGRELHKTDGTNTELVKDIVVPGSSAPDELTEVDGKLFFTANDPLLTGRELWTSDGTSNGTQLVQDIRSGFDLYGKPLSGEPLDLTDVDGTLFFTVADDQDDREVWTSNGNAAGTSMLKNINPGTRDANVQQVVEVGSKLFFVADDGINGEAVWVSDLTNGTTALAADVTASPSDKIHGLAKFGTGVIFQNNTLGVYTTDGTTTTAITSETPVAFNRDGALFAEAGSFAYMVLRDATDGEELWKTNGSAPELVQDIHDGDSSSEPRDLVDLGGMLYFSADYSDEFGEDLGRELMRTDGTANGTALVFDVNVDPNPSDPSAPTTLSSDPEELTVSGGKLYFTAESGTSNVSGNTGRELWVTDGSIGNASLVANIRSGSGDSDPTELTDVNGVLYFSANDGSDGFEPFRSEGTSETTNQVADINGNGSSDPTGFLQVGAHVYFTAREADTGRELYRSDGTPLNTSIVQDLQVGTDSSNPTPLAQLPGDRLLFAASANGEVNREFWVAGLDIDGVIPGLDMNPGPFLGSNPESLIANGSEFVFVGDDGLNGRELHRLIETAASVEHVVIDDGSGQRSTIGDVTLRFNTKIDVDGDAFEFVNTTTGQSVVDIPSFSSEGGKTVVTFAFAPGDSVNSAGLLNNGNYQLTVNASLVSSVGLALDGNGDGAAGDDYVLDANSADKFYRKFGDSNANGTVDLVDFANFRRSFGSNQGDSSWDPTFDNDGDNTVGLLDFAEFRRNYGS